MDRNTSFDVIGRKKEEGRGKKEEGRGKREEGRKYYLYLAILNQL
ncbi:hypothetical protein [Lyngbya sp. CCAP 1446/10]|nr:hypothetical protein [Lyngbya sp. CCAP 1446/10]